MPRLSKTRYAVLGALTVRPGSGYDIKKLCDNTLSFFWAENYGQIYPVLKQLEEEGLVSKETEMTEGKPARNVYHITDEGRAELNDWLLLPVEPSTHRMELILKLVFAADIPASNLICKLEEKKAKEEKTLQYLEEAEGRLKDGPQDRPGLHLWLAGISMGRHLSKASLDWCEETIAMLQQHVSDNERTE